MTKLCGDDFTSAIRKVCGCEQKVLQSGFLKCKACDLKCCVCFHCVVHE